jgi:hypothetical protein
MLVPGGGSMGSFRSSADQKLLTPEAMIAALASEHGAIGPSPGAGPAPRVVASPSVPALASTSSRAIDEAGLNAR